MSYERIWTSDLHVLLKLQSKGTRFVLVHEMGIPTTYHRRSGSVQRADQGCGAQPWLAALEIALDAHKYAEIALRYYRKPESLLSG